MVVLYNVELHGKVIALEVTRTYLEQLAKDAGNVGAIAVPLAGQERRREQLHPDGLWWFLGPPTPYIHFFER